MAVFDENKREDERKHVLLIIENIG